MSTHQFSALLGFGFAVVWITLGLGDAVLALAAAATFAGATAVAVGDLDLAELQDRLRAPQDGPFGDRPGSAGPRVR